MRAKVIFTACLRNATAVAKAATRFGSTIALIPAGERWPDGSHRPCVEDLIGAGAILAALAGRPSPEAEIAMAAFDRARSRCVHVISECASGRELIERGFREDVALAAELDASTTVPVLRERAFTRA